VLTLLQDPSASSAAATSSPAAASTAATITGAGLEAVGRWGLERSRHDWLIDVDAGEHPAGDEALVIAAKVPAVGGPAPRPCPAAADHGTAAAAAAIVGAVGANPSGTDVGTVPGQPYLSVVR
jgi:hypothetical protein